MRGGSLDDVRASGQAGNDIEGIAGGVGHTLNRDRPLVDDRRVRGTTGRAPGSGPPSRVRAQIVPNGGLRTHEDRGGHTLQKHVDKSVAELAERLVREKRITGSSSFSGRESAESAIAGALEANDGAIKSWLASGPSRPLVIRHSEAAPVGVSLPRGAAQPVPASKLVVVLMPDAGTSTGYRIHTAYPTL